ncbi:MAG: tubulin-like protein [Methanobacteriaceae archaeon]|nr:tubulin-like protein [Methanobacteriaceae archaeon]
MEIKIKNSSIAIEELPIQNYNNISIIPLKSNSSTKADIMSLKKGLELGLVEVKECEPSTVNTIMVTNNAVTPLILVDGDEITGAKQNRIVNTTILIPPKTTMPVSVSCTEHGRWHFKDNSESKAIFSHSEYFANSNTRRAKAQNSYNDMDCQAVVWDSISQVESRMEFKSATAALNDSYENVMKDQEECIEHFKVLDGQTGLIAIIDGEVRGVELFANHRMYKDYHDKIIKSYIIDSLNTENIENNLSNEEIIKIVEDISNSKVKKDTTKGLGESFKFSNDYGNGSALVYDGEIIHMPYFKNADGFSDSKYSEDYIII